MPAEPPHIVFAEKFEDDAVERMRAIGHVTTLDSCDEATLAAVLPKCDALMVRTYSRITRYLLERTSRLRVIGRGGVGLENIDVEAARKRGIAVVYTPAAATDAVADLTVGMMIALLRDLRVADAAVRAGKFYEARGQARSKEVSDLTLGIIGMGRIGQAVAQRCRHGFGMSILYNDIVRPGWLGFTATPVEKEELYENADIVSLHVPLTDKTNRLVCDESLAHFKAGSLLINTSRGAVVDSEALARALSAGKLGGAALDVFEPEPLPPDHPLLKAPNTLFTPHLAARTHTGLRRMSAVVDDVIRVLENKSPLYPA